MTSPDEEWMRDVLRRVARPVALDDAAAERVLDRTLQRYEERRRPHLSDAEVESLRIVPAERSLFSDRVRRSVMMMAASFVLIVAIGLAIVNVTGRETDESQLPLQDTIAASTVDSDSPEVATSSPESSGRATSTTPAPDATDPADSSTLPANLLGLAPFTTRRLSSAVVDGSLSYQIRAVGAAPGSGDATALDVRFAAGTATDPPVAPHPVRTATVNRDGTVVIPLEMLYPPVFGGPCEGGAVLITTTTEIETTLESTCAGSPTDVRIESSIGDAQSIEGVTATPITYEITPVDLDPARIVWWFDADGVVRMTYTVDGADVDLT